MGNQQPMYVTLQQPLANQGIPYAPQTQIGVPVTALPANTIVVVPLHQDDDCCGPNIPSCGGSNSCIPNYGPGIKNTPYYGQGNNQSCNFNNGCGQGGNLQQNQSMDEWCCGPSNYVIYGGAQPQMIAQTIPTQVVPTVSPVSNDLPLIVPPLQIVEVDVQTNIHKDTYADDVVLHSVIETDFYNPTTPTIFQTNPFANLPLKITTVIEQLGSVNPLRGSVLRRLEAPKYVPEKQAFYEGQWISGYMQGFGRLYFDSGAYFEGEFINGLAQTKHGLFIYPDGSYYIGGVDRNVANGQGEFNYRGGRLIYKGQFLNDQPDGHGVQLYYDGSKYEGEFRFGKKEGRGDFVWRDGTVYSGQFENGFMQGEGTHRFSNGQIYEGEFRKNKRHGRGKHTSPLGVYAGGYKRDKKQGEGQFIWADGKIFKGNFHDGKPDGPGSVSLANGSVVYGMWINGELDRNSVTDVSPYRGSQINSVGRGSIASVGSVDSAHNIQYLNQARSSQIMNGPPMINLTGGMLGGGFTGRPSPFVNQRGSIISVVGLGGGDYRGPSPSRGSNIVFANPMIRGSNISPSPINLPQGISSGIGRTSNIILNQPQIARQSQIMSQVIPQVAPFGGRTSTIAFNAPLRGSTVMPQIIQKPPSVINPLSGSQFRPATTNNFITPNTTSIPIRAPQTQRGLGINPLSQVNSFNIPNRNVSISPTRVANTSQFLSRPSLPVIPQVSQAAQIGQFNQPKIIFR